MNGAELVVRCLQGEGVKYCFGLPGEENLELLRALSDSPIKTIITRDERGAAFMANAYGRFTGMPGVCFSTLGPGATNLVTGVADGLLDFAPMVAITAQASSLRRHKESHQYIDTLSLFRAITKWNVAIERTEIIPESIRKAFRLAAIEKPGPTHIELPEDTALMEAKGSPIEPVAYHYPVCDEDRLKTAAGLIRDSKMPIILAGHGAIRNRVSAELVRFAQRAGIAVATTFMGMGAIAADHELFVSNIGLQSRDYIQCGINKADLIIAVGYDPVEFSPKWWDNTKRIIHIDTNPAEVDINYVALEVLGDMAKNLHMLTELITDTKDYSYYLKLREDLQADLLDGAMTSSEKGLSPLTIIRAIRNALKRDDILISDVGAHKIWIGRCYPAYEPNTVIISNGFASMGVALPYAITASLLYPQRRILAAVGDGGFMMSACELETAVRMGLAFTVVIFNDNGYGLIQWKQHNRYKSDFFVGLSNPDFVKLAESFGCKGYRVEKAHELESALKETALEKVPTIVECLVDYSVNLKLTERLGSIVCRV
jgi:acetolactate synthase-1/2/3 large subunit